MFDGERAIAIVANQQPDALRKQQRGGLAPFGLRIIRTMQLSAARGKTAECVAKRSSGDSTANASSVAEAMAGSTPGCAANAIVRRDYRPRTNAAR